MVEAQVGDVELVGQVGGHAERDGRNRRVQELPPRLASRRPVPSDCRSISGGTPQAARIMAADLCAELEATDVLPSDGAGLAWASRRATWEGPLDRLRRMHERRNEARPGVYGLTAGRAVRLPFGGVRVGSKWGRSEVAGRGGGGEGVRVAGHHAGPAPRPPLASGIRDCVRRPVTGSGGASTHARALPALH